MVSGAIRTDFILSAEIMVIALNEVADEPFVSRAAILAVVAIGITVLVYGVVALIVKMDDVGAAAGPAELARRPAGRAGPWSRRCRSLLTVISVVGVAAMLWVGGHILLVGADDLGWHAPTTSCTTPRRGRTTPSVGVGAVAGWLVNTVASAVVGLVVGVVVVGVMHVLPRRRTGGRAH